MAKKIWTAASRAAVRPKAPARSGSVGTDCKSSIRRWITMVGPAADIARDAAQHDAEDHAQRHRHEADRHRGLRAVHDARPLVPPEPIRAEQEDARLGSAGTIRWVSVSNSPRTR